MDTPDIYQAGSAIPACTSLREVLCKALASHGRQTAFSCEGASLSYRELDPYSDQFTAWLFQDSTLQPGDPIAIQLPDILQYPIMALRVIKAVMVIVNITPLYIAGEIEHQLKGSGVRVLVTLEEVLHVTSNILRRNLRDKQVI